MNKTIVYGLTIFTGIILVAVMNMKQDFNKIVPSSQSQPRMVDGKIPPRLTDLFKDKDTGPHQKFVNEKSCLKCHKQEITIPGLGEVPKIPHEFRSDCVSCHLLPPS